MSLPDLFPKKSNAGIVVDPSTLTRVVPESKRADGSVRKELKIRPGFTPQEDIGRFKTSRQMQREQTALPRGHIVDWLPPEPQPGPSASTGTSSEKGGKSAKKNQKKKDKKEKDKMDLIAASWEVDLPKPPKTKKPDLSKGDQDEDDLNSKLGSLHI